MQSNSLRLAALTGALSTLVAIVACSGGSGTAGVGGPPIPADQLGKTYVEKVCAAIQTCCNQNGFAEAYKTCTNGAAAVQADFDKSRTRHPEYTYDAQKAGNCVAKIASAYTSCNLKAANIDDDVDCEGFLRGSKSAGASCESSQECASLDSMCLGQSSTASSDGGSSSTSGICVAVKRPAEGDPCFDYNGAPKADKVYGDCRSDDNFYCDPTSKTCKARGGAGTTCVTTVDDRTTSVSQACSKDTTCDTTAKKCVGLAAVGEACTPNSGYGCVKSAYCDPESKKCAAQKAAGESCDVQAPNQCVHGCDSESKKCRSNPVSRKTCAGDLD